MIGFACRRAPRFRARIPDRADRRREPRRRVAGAPRSGTQSVERAIAVLECFASSDRSLGLTEIARGVGLTPSTAHRLLRALIAARYVEQDPTTEHYRLGIGIAVLGQRALEHSGYNLARPVLERLSATPASRRASGSAAATEVVVIERASESMPHCDSIIRPAQRSPCTRRPWARCSSHSPPTRSTHEVDRLGRLEPFTEATITAPSRSGRGTRPPSSTLGYATNLEERYPGVCGVAAPVRSSIGCAHASVGVQGPSVRLTPQRLRELAPFVVAAANDVASLVVRVVPDTSAGDDLGEHLLGVDDDARDVRTSRTRSSRHGAGSRAPGCWRRCRSPAGSR